MAVMLKCKMCGGDLLLTEGSTIATCEYCGTQQTVPTLDNEKKLSLFTRANKLRASCEFDKAAGIYESIVAEFPEEAESYWGLILCKYGIEYVDDPATGKKIPTCHRSSFDSVVEDANFELTMENADAASLKVYRREAKQIEEIRKGIIEVSSKEDPYDIFICYKETDANGDRTVDSLIAQNIYDALSEKGYRVFFSRITLEDKLGVAYEPYIFAALNSAKIMLAVGTAYEHYNAVWVKNEWNRYLKLMETDKSKHLIPCFKDIDVYDIPKEFKHLQAQDMGKVGAIQDLVRGIDKLIAPVKKEPTAVSANGNDLIGQTLERAYAFLNEEDWSAAKKCLDTVLGYDPHNVSALIGSLMLKLRIPQEKKLSNCRTILEKEELYQLLIKIADTATKQRLETYNKDTRYAVAMDKANSGALAAMKEAADELARLGNWKDAQKQLVALQKKIAKQSAANKKRFSLIVSTVVAIALIVGFLVLKKNYLAPNRIYKQGVAQIEAGDYDGAVATFQALNDNSTYTGKGVLALMDAQQYGAAVNLLLTMEQSADTEALINECRSMMNTNTQAADAIISALEEQSGAEETEQNDAFDALMEDALVMQSVETIKNAQLGDIVEFGSLNGEEFEFNGPISWYVIAKENGRALLLSKESIAEDGNDSLVWKGTSLRKWLNDTFFNAAFSPAERDLIPTVAVTSKGWYSPKGETEVQDYDPTRDTEDKVSLLGSTEAQALIDQELIDFSRWGMWTLRSSGAIGDRVIESSGGHGNVHPVIWVESGE